MTENKEIMLHDVKARENVLLRNVYLWMLAGLGVTAAVSYLASNSAAVLRYITLNPVGTIVLVIAELAVVFVLSGRIESLRTGTAIALFLGYSALTGLALSSVFLAYTGTTITMAFVAAMLAFAGAAAWGTFTKRDIRGWGQYMFMALFGILAASLLNLLFRSSAFDFLICLVGVALFTGLTAWDARKVAEMNWSYGTQMTSEELTKVGILGALELYLDFLNIFLYLLRLFSRSDN